MLAMTGCGEYGSVAEAMDRLVKFKETIMPEPDLCALYDERYKQFSLIYPACRELFPKLQADR